MSNNIDGKTSPHYIEAVNQNYTVNTMNQTKSISCVASSFENVDPLVGIKKQCMCDNDQTITTRENIQTIKDSWRQRNLLADLFNSLNTAESRLKNDTEAADASSNAVDAIENTTHSENSLEKAQKDKEDLDKLNSTGRASCDSAKQTSLDAAAKKDGLKEAQDLADSTKATASASTEKNVREPSEENSAKATTDANAAIDAAIALAALQERLSNAELDAELNYDLCLTRLRHSLEIKQGDLTCENEADAALFESSISHADEMRILENKHLHQIMADEALHVSELKRLISEAEAKELALHKERERLAKEQFEKSKKNYDDEMQKIRDNIAEAQRLAIIHIKELQDEAKTLMKQANATAAW